MKVAINSCFGGFGLSIKGVELYAEKAGFNVYHYTTDYSDGYDKSKHVRADSAGERRSLCTFHLKEDIGDNPTNEELNAAEWFNDRDIKRDDPYLIEVIEELGEESYGSHAKLTVVEIPDDVDYIIEEYDGSEHIAEKHRTWY